tara:strand:+ start:45 stop:449 length:405 start_codon:yes stop_codon:yes gene_type:complete
MSQVIQKKKLNYRIEYDEEIDNFIVTYDEPDDDDHESSDPDGGLEFKHDFRYLEFIKDHYGWKEGEEMLLHMKQNCDGWFKIWYDENDKNKNKHCCNLIIEKNGYVKKRFWQHYCGEPFYVRVLSYYNDDMGRD